MILILAAGASSRMKGRDKLAEKIDGMPLLVHVVQRAVQSGCPVAVTIPDISDDRAKLLEGVDGIGMIEVPDAVEGMSASIRAGVGAHSSADAIMILPGDMPDITAMEVSEMIAFYERAPKNTILRATSEGGVPGHPVIFPHSLFSDLVKLTGDQGARSVLQRNKCRIMAYPLAANHATTDLDTPEAWEAWRKLNEDG